MSRKYAKHWNHLKKKHEGETNTLQYFNKTQTVC